MAKTLVVIPCSGRKTSGGVEGLAWSARHSSLRGLSRRGGDKLLAARRELAHRFRYRADSDLGGEPSESECLLPAWQRYDGNLYRKIDSRLWQSLGDEVDVVIVSALYGLVAPTEAIRHYDRAMAKHIAPRTTLGRWWADHNLGLLLVEYVETGGAVEVHDFLGGAYERIGRPLDSLRGHIRLSRHSYPGLGSGADHHRGRDVARVIASCLG